MASSISSSLISFASPSTITMESSDPATINSIEHLSISEMVGLTINCPSNFPTRTEAIGPSKGISDIPNAVDAPTAARTSASFPLSIDIIVAIICVSDLKLSGNSGLIGRSIRRAERISFSEGLPSRLKKPPGIFPAA